jgi:RNA polymerase sigma-70 factor (ECF subfamily)
MWTAHAQRLDDSALLSAMATGDQAAAEVFVRRHERAVYGLAYTMCRDARLAEDLAQQTFERVWKHAEGYDSRRASVKVWMLTITRRLCIDVFRTNRSMPVDPHSIMPMLPAADEAVEAQAIAGGELHRMRDVLAGLPAEQRRALVLASIGGHTMAEIAAIEQIPIGTVKTRLRMALIRMRRELLPAGADDE